MSSLDPRSPVETPVVPAPSAGWDAPSAGPTPTPRSSRTPARSATGTAGERSPSGGTGGDAGTAALPEEGAIEIGQPLEVPCRPLTVAGGALRTGRHRRPDRFGRRPALVLAGALAVTLGTGLAWTGTAASAGAATGSPAVSVATKLGLTSAKNGLSAPAATNDLEELAASRATRQAAQTAAAQVQAAADSAAVAEATRPRAVLPAQGCVFTSGFGMRWGTLHAGIDLAGPIGTPEYAAEDGVVVQAGPASGFGQAVYIQHANGDVTVYGHMEKILVTAGQVVKAGDTIALMGAEGEATGPHLHFEVHLGGIMGPKVDPVPWLAARGVQV